MENEYGEEEVALWFKELSGEYGKFEKVENKLSKRSDLHAFILLDKLFGGSDDIISCAEHDMIVLCVSSDQYNQLTKEQVLELVRCGVMYDYEYELHMWV